MHLLSLTNTGRGGTRNLLTDELQDAFCAIIRQGNYYTTACQLLGVKYRSFRQWMQTGAASPHEDNIYRRFYLAVLQADAYCELEIVDRWRENFKKDYKAPRDFLDRRFNEKWGDRKKVMIETEKQVDHMMSELRQRLAPDVYTQLEAAVNGYYQERNDQHRLSVDDDIGSIDSEFSGPVSPAHDGTDPK